MGDISFLVSSLDSVDEINLLYFKVDMLCDLCRSYDLGDIVYLVSYLVSLGSLFG